MKTGIELIAEERQRQIEVEGYDTKHHVNEVIDRLVADVINYAMYDIDKQEAWWSWNFKYKDKQRILVKAGALIAAAIDRLQKDNDQQ